MKSIIQLYDWHPTALRDLDYPDQCDIPRGDPIVPDKPALVVGIVRLRSGQLAIVR
jgi:hypothetical protein